MRRLPIASTRGVRWFACSVSLLAACGGRTTSDEWDDAPLGTGGSVEERDQEGDKVHPGVGGGADPGYSPDASPMGADGGFPSCGNRFAGEDRSASGGLSGAARLSGGSGTHDDLSKPSSKRGLRGTGASPGSKDAATAGRSGEGGASADCDWPPCELVTDRCPPKPVNGCSILCETLPDSCVGQPTRGQYSATKVGLTESTSSKVVRIPGTLSERGNICGEVTDYYRLSSIGAEDSLVRISVGPGWQMAPISVQHGRGSVGCNLLAEGCLILPPPPDSGSRQAYLLPTTATPVERNVLVEVVPEGTTCP